MPKTKTLLWPVFLVIIIFTLAGGMLSCVVRTPDRDNNPPGPSGGPGTNWENPPGPSGGPGTSPNRRRWSMAVPAGDGQWWERDDNPPGTNWENLPGPSAGPGTSPNR
jgi:hypothetical protein